MARDPNPLVFSTDGSHARACTVCGRNPCVCPPAAEIVPARTTLKLKLETGGRRGKAVTVVFGLPAHPTYFGELTRTLKAHCGAGGALTAEGMEIQGDQREKVQAYLERLGFTVRRSGG